MMKKVLPLLLFFIPFLGLAQQPYYNDVDLTLEGTALRDELSNKVIVTHTNNLSYTPGIWNASKITDEDPDNPNNVLLIYGYDDNDGDYVTDRSRDKNDNGGTAGTDWNREHVYAKSLGTPSFDNVGPGADAHHLRPSDVTMNSIRGNRRFTDGSGNAGTVGSHFYPGDEWKGDVARMMMYMYLRWGTQTLPSNVAVGTQNAVDPNMIDLLLEWNAEDPVSQIEDQRNAYHDSDATYAQGNRNPFIDNPYLATRIWGGPVAENRWGDSNDDEAPTAPLNLTATNVTAYTADLSWDASTDNIGVTGYSIYVDGESYTSTSNTSITLTGLDPETTYSIEVYAVDAAANLSEASNQVQITTQEGGTVVFEEDFNDCNTVDQSFVPYSQTSNIDWECADQFGHNGTGSYQMNAYDGNNTVQSIDWLITTNPIDFSSFDDARLSFYTDASFGDTVLELLYSSDYDGSGNAEDFTWTPVPNVEIPTHSGAEQEEIYTFDNIDISSINGSVYFAFRYDTDGGLATRWTVDNFIISSGNVMSVENSEIFNFSVYPNPSQGNINILAPQSSNVEIQVFDLTGKLILSRKEMAAANGEVSIQNLPSGLFLLKITSQGKTATKKIIVR